MGLGTSHQPHRLALLGLMGVFLLCSACAGSKQDKFYRPYAGKGTREYRSAGTASWYGHPFHGRRTASGERYNMNHMTAAHKTLPFGAMIKVTNLDNGYETLVKITDRGPFVRGRIIDLSRAAATELGFKDKGTARVTLEWVDDAHDHPNLIAREKIPTPAPETTVAEAPRAPAEDELENSPEPDLAADPQTDPSESDSIASVIADNKAKLEDQYWLENP